ncbi:MAG TPA: adenosylhomocysteinase, partial [Methanomassiliicoccales archaeon]|nr:adenosylhomocysteinase [Methanomassiliicoccales archaeon]
MDSELLIKGSRRLGWAEAHMAVLREVGERMRQEGSLRGVRVGMALHVEAKTGMLAVTLSRAGAKVRLASCNPLSTDDSVALALREERGIEVFARKGESSEEYYENLNAVLDLRPEFVIDDGADLITMLHTSRRELLGEVKGGNEE